MTPDMLLGFAFGMLIGGCGMAAYWAFDIIKRENRRLSSVENATARLILDVQRLSAQEQTWRSIKVVQVSPSLPDEKKLPLN